jgi:hypothetical protein
MKSNGQHERKTKMKMKKMLVGLCAAGALFATVGEASAAGKTGFMAGVYDEMQNPTPDYEVDGLALGLLWSECAGLSGAQGSIGANFDTGSGVGLQYSIFGGNFCKKDFTGVQWGHLGIDVCEGSFTGVQLSLVNLSHDFTGLQLGFFNMTDSMYGVQIGLVNVIKESPLWVFPFVNAYF